MSSQQCSLRVFRNRLHRSTVACQDFAAEPHAVVLASIDQLLLRDFRTLERGE